MEMETILEEESEGDRKESYLSESIVEGLSKNGFKINVVHMENMEPEKKVIVKVVLNDKLVGESEEILVQDAEAELSWETFHEVSEETEGLVDELITNPLVFTVLSKNVSPEVVDSAEPKKGKSEKGRQSKGTSEKGKSNKEPSVSNDSKKTGKSAKQKQNAPSSEEFSVLGICNLDVLPLILGEKNEIEEVLLLNPTTESKGSDIIAWENLPKVKVIVSTVGNLIDNTFKCVSNVISFTLESLYNIEPDINKVVEAATILPNDQVIKFKGGVLLLDDSVWISKRKKWLGLKDLQGQGSLSAYKVSDNVLDVLNTTDYDISNNSLSSKPRILWNQFHRSYINAEMEKAFKEKIVTNNCWPVEVLMYESEEKSEGKKKNEKPSGEKDHFITFLDVTKLIYPGEKSVRLTSQLYTYTDEIMKTNFGSSLKLFEETVTPKDVEEAKPKKAPSKKDAKPESSKSPKSKKGSVKSKKDKPAKEEVEELVENEPDPAKQSEPVYNADGEPIFVLVHVELLHPLIKKQDEKQVLERINEIIPIREPPTAIQLETVNNHRMYENCVNNLVHCIHEEYQVFFNANECLENSSKNFLMHLQMKGVYAKMVESMKEAVSAQVKDYVGTVDNWGALKYEGQDILTSLYQQLVNKMYCIVNAIPDPSCAKYEPEVTCHQLKYYRCEAMEEDDYDRAHYYLLQSLEKSEKADTQVWTDFGMYWKNILEFDKAEECAKEAISLNPKHTNALLFYGLLSWLMEDLAVAEMFLLAVVSFTPSHLEGWVTLYMLHKQMEKQKEANVEILNAKDCTSEFIPENGAALPLSWRADTLNADRIFLITAAKLLNLSFPEFAELALSYDLLLHGRTVNYLYFLAVCHYQQGRYENSLSHLEEALKLQWEDDRLWALKGHNLYKLQKLEEAKDAFNVSLNFSVYENDTLHLINLRLGNILMAQGDHQGAQERFKVICRDSPTPLAWLGLGISAFVGDDIESAELALTEANTLDNRIGRVWGYLALVNLLMDKPLIFNRCILQAFKCGFDDPVLAERIDSLVKLVQPSSN